MEGRLGPVLMERIHFLEAMPPARYYALLSLATLVVDTPCYAGSLTAYDSFSVGAPVLTQPGPLAVQCYAAGLYRRMGLDELVARDRDDFVARAVAIGRDPAWRDHLAGLLRERDHLVFDDPEVIPEYQRFFLGAAGRDSPPRRFEHSPCVPSCP
jgi:predicted O-linked N-acetylglucosamine transferase (SPINDLY family)